MKWWELVKNSLEACASASGGEQDVVAGWQDQQLGRKAR